MKTTQKMVRALAVTLTLIGSLAGEANAATTTVNGDFDIVYSQVFPFYQGVPDLMGTWQFTFDDQGGGFTGNVNGAVVALSTMQIGSTSFDQSNSTVTVALQDGFVNSITLQATSGLNPSTDSFAFFYSEDGFDINPLGLRIADVSTSTTSMIQGADDSGNPNAPGTAFGTYEVVPEPSSVTLIALAFTAAFFRRRRI